MNHKVRSACRSVALSGFHPEVAGWFAETFGSPTEIQEQAWRLIAGGEHCLISAATGSGKTLAAFLWSLNQLIVGEWEPGQTRVLYISPLKALNNDIRRNLLSPLAELKERFAAEGLDWPEIRVMTRSGDTEQADRRKMLRRPPEILITTPESLNLLLTSKDGRRSLLGIRSVILDEIHSVVGSKRGVYLMTAIERLAHLNGEFQRVALSATVKPMEKVAAFVGGFIDGKPRPVRLAESSVSKRYEIEVRFPENFDEDQNEDDSWNPIVQELKRLIEENKSTLVFVNSRMLCEKIAHKLNFDEDEPIAYSHHGSLSKEIRSAVEQRLKNGELKAIVATNSLEMGIDVGSLDCVVMVQSPNLISSAIQKVGRAGHQVGAVSRAVVFPSHSRDFLEAAVLSESIRERDIEEVKPIERPLDVLAQVIVSSLGAGPMDIDELFAIIRASYPYRDLAREQFDLVLNMLAGRYAGSRLRELKPRVSLNAATNEASLRKGALMAFYFSGGVIPDRGYFHLRLSADGGRLGELDEEFVWERSIGDVFTLGVQSWKIDRITYNDVFVVPAPKGAMAPPFWKAERYNRDFHFSNRIGEFLEWADSRVESKEFAKELQRRFALQASAAERLRDFLRNQKLVTRCSLPHRRHIVAEYIDAAPGGAPGQQLVLHTHWGGRVNRPYALALDAAWYEVFGHRTEIYVNDDCVVVMMTEGVTLEEIVALVTPDTLDGWLRKRLEGSGFFGARFREAAGNALLITRNRAGQRLPLWLSRLRAKKLFESVQRFDDFPLLLETWRTCLKDEFDMEALRRVLGEFEQGEIALSVARCSQASPFASSVAWRQINDEYMYATDDPSSSGQSSLRDDLVKAVAFDDAMRPRVPIDVIQAFEAKRQRTEPGYGPSDWTELKEWLRDRVVMEAEEWARICAGVEEVEIDSAAIATSGRWVYLREEEDRVAELLASEPDDGLLVEWLSYFGPVPIKCLQAMFGLDEAVMAGLIDVLSDDRRAVFGTLVDGSDESYVCETENFEILLRMNRTRNRAMFQPLPLQCLSLFLARWQGLVNRSEGADGVRGALDQLLGFAASIDEWERTVLPARVEGYQPSWLDAVLLEDGMAWKGVGEGRVALALEDDLAMLGEGEGATEVDSLDGRLMATLENGGRYSFVKLQEILDTAASELEASLWKLVWQGRISNDAFAAARRGSSGKFALCESVSSPALRSRPTRFGRKLRAPRVATYPGSWYALPEFEALEDPIEKMEYERECARVVLERYGVVFRELLQRESPGFRWKDVFKALRLLELSGEVIGGRFFDGVLGLQFVSKKALRELKRGLEGSAFYWMAATDPASLCGLGLDELKGHLPARRMGTALVYQGDRLVAESQRGGKSLVFHVGSDDEDLPLVLNQLERAIGLDSPGFSRLQIEEINGSDARYSPYLESLDKAFRLHCDHKNVVVEGRR